MNPGVLQCKNCWKWGHTAGVCCIQGAKCVRCNRPHLSEYHCYFAWCCKANNKTNPSRLETKKGELCPHSFKCLNCKGEHQADLNECLFWKHHVTNFIQLVSSQLVDRFSQTKLRWKVL